MIITLISVFSLAWISNAMPLAYKMVDLTYVKDETNHRHPLMKEFKIDSVVNGTMESLGGQWVQMEEYSSATHLGTHIDAPSHAVKGGINIDQIPISQFIGPAAVIDITAKAQLDPDAEATIEDLLLWESGTGQSLNGTIILLESGWGHKWHDQMAFMGNADNDMVNLHYPGISAEASQWLVDNRDIKGVGTEAVSVDRGTSRDFRSHRILLGHGLFILENVANVYKLPVYGAKLHVFPMKIGKASGAPARIIATIPENTYNLRNRKLTNHLPFHLIINCIFQCSNTIKP